MEPRFHVRSAASRGAGGIEGGSGGPHASYSGPVGPPVGRAGPINEQAAAGGGRLSGGPRREAEGSWVLGRPRWVLEWAHDALPQHFILMASANLSF